MKLRLMIVQMGFVWGVFFGISANASASDQKFFSYLGFKSGYSHQSASKSDPMSPDSSSMSVPPSSGPTTLSAYTTPAIPIGVVGGVGYYFFPKIGMRLEAEYLYRTALSSRKPSIQQSDPNAPENFDIVNILTNTSSALVNAYVDYYIFRKVNVYLGAGIGAGILDTSLKLINNSKEGKIQGGKVNFAWQIGGGIGMNLTQHIKFDVGARLVNFGKTALDTHQLMTTSPNFSGDLLSFGITNIEALAGLSYYF